MLIWKWTWDQTYVSQEIPMLLFMKSDVLDPEKVEHYTRFISLLIVILIL